MTIASTAIVVESVRDRATVRRPTSSASRVPAVASRASAEIRPRVPGRRAISRKDATNDAESRTNAGQNWPATPTINPARPAPVTNATTRVAWVRELAARRPSGGTTRGRRAPRAGVKKVPIVAWTKART
jgi:hypothetical protein